MNRIGKILAQEYKIVKEGNYSTMEALKKATDAAKKESSLCNTVMQAFEEVSIVFIFDNVDFVGGVEDPSGKEIATLHAELHAYFSTRGISAQMIFISTRKLNIHNMVTIRMPCPDSESLKLQTSTKFREHLEKNSKFQEWLRTFIPDPVVQQKNLDNLSANLVDLLIDTCKDYDVFAKMPSQYASYILQDGPIMNAKSKTSLNSLLVSRTGKLNKLLLIDPKYAFHRFEDVWKLTSAMTDVL